MRHLFTIGVIVAGLCAGMGRHAAAADEFLGATMSEPRSAIAVKWRAIQSQMNDDAAQLAACRADTEACSTEDKRFDTIIDAARMREGMARIGEINRTVNLTIRPMSDMRRFGMRDHWSTPLETLQAGVGDCEDYAILKYLALREAGFAEDDLQFLIVRDSMLQADHAVVAVRHEGHWIVLDNRTLVLADLQSTLQFKRYRVLVQLGREIDAPDYAGLMPLSLAASM